jgi:hypothetical protein
MEAWGGVEGHGDLGNCVMKPSVIDNPYSLLIIKVMGSAKMNSTRYYHA